MTRRNACRPEPTTTSPSRWMSTSCCRSCASGWRSRGAGTPVTSTAFDIELPLLLEAVYRKYHYDFRGYASASLKRRLTQAMGRFGCRTLSQLQDRLLHEPALFPALLDFLTVQVSQRFCDTPDF